jgi:GNAT superfamily N-acetyltransferase
METRMTQFQRTTSNDKDFQNLVHLLDNDLAERDGKELNSFYVQFNKIDMLKNVIVCYVNETPVGCGAFKEFTKSAVEIKRMFVQPNFRGQRIGASVLEELERWAAEINYEECVLETGKQNPEALHLYQKEGYQIIPNFGQYKGVENSICMKKSI